MVLLFVIDHLVMNLDAATTGYSTNKCLSLDGDKTIPRPPLVLTFSLSFLFALIVSSSNFDSWKVRDDACEASRLSDGVVKRCCRAESCLGPFRCTAMCRTSRPSSDRTELMGEIGRLPDYDIQPTCFRGKEPKRDMR